MRSGQSQGGKQPRANALSGVSLYTRRLSPVTIIARASILPALKRVPSVTIASRTLPGEM
jgi:hypothetical protein